MLELLITSFSLSFIAKKVLRKFDEITSKWWIGAKWLVISSKRDENRFGIIIDVRLEMSQSKMSSFIEYDTSIQNLFAKV